MTIDKETLERARAGHFIVTPHGSHEIKFFGAIKDGGTKEAKWKDGHYLQIKHGNTYIQMDDEGRLMQPGGQQFHIVNDNGTFIKMPMNPTNLLWAKPGDTIITKDNTKIEFKKVDPKSGKVVLQWPGKGAVALRASSPNMVNGSTGKETFHEFEEFKCPHCFIKMSS